MHMAQNVTDSLPENAHSELDDEEFYELIGEKLESGLAGE